MTRARARARGAADPFAVPSVVVVYLREPPAKLWGVLRSLDLNGAALEGVDLRSFDDWLSGVAAREIGPGDCSLAFYPMARIEKILLDRGSEASPSLGDQFRARVGVGIVQFLSKGARRR
jgi:hypothetical protein